jgi:hypothetical protein
MADSDALRTRRKRMHAAGDHSLCRRCAAVKAPGGVLGPVPLSPEAAAAIADAETELRGLAERLKATNEADPANSLIARELRMTLQVLLESEKRGARPGKADGIGTAAAVPDRQWASS